MKIMPQFPFCRFALAVALLAGLAHGQASKPTVGAATLVVSGDVSTPLRLKAEDLALMPREKFSIPDQDGTEVEYEGVALREILRRAGAPFGNQLRGSALTTYVIAKASDGYQVVFTLGELDAAFGNEKVLVADKREGKPLFEYQGPFRLVCPGDKAGARSVRMLEGLEIVRLKK
jgi:DMSO/TMAO reductase YedYZ molybdopterin-dependent catalytic subunit